MKVQLPLFDTDSTWNAPDILPEWQNADVIALDTETCDPKLTTHGPAWPWRGGFVAGYAVGMLHGARQSTYYLPIRHQEGGNLDEERVRGYIDEIARSQIPKVFHNSLYDLGWMWADGIEVVRGPLHDTQVGAALLDENRKSFSLDNVCKDWLGEGKDEEHLKKAGIIWGFKKDVKSNLWRLPAKHVGPYAEGDVAATLRLWQYEQEMLTSNDLMNIYQLEMQVIPVLLEMRKRGIRVDEQKAEESRVIIVEKEKEVHRNIKKQWGVTVDVWSADSMARAFDKLGLKYEYTPKGAPSFTKEFLQSHVHEFPTQCRQLRKLGKTINTFIDGQIGTHAHEGRIHTELHPLKSNEGGTVSGRLSSSNPNLQQNTSHDDFLSPIVRGLFLPEEGDLWGALDYSSQEPRLTIHYAHLTRQRGAAEAVDQYRSNPRTDYHQMVADFCGIVRKPAKTINLGLAYGMGGAKLCHSLKLPTAWMVKLEQGWVRADQSSETYPCYEIAGAEGQALLDTYHEKVPFIKGLMTTTDNLAQQRGYIKTILGRRCRFDRWEPARGRGAAYPLTLDEALERGKTDPRWASIRRAHTQKALNRLIQGSAADQTKKAMVEMFKEGITPLLQMHDEIDLSVNTEQQWRMAEQIMIECVPLEVPVVVDAEFGRNWGDAKHSWSKLVA